MVVTHQTYVRQIYIIKFFKVNGFANVISLSIEESLGLLIAAPKVAEADVDRGSLESIDWSAILTPGSPDLLAFRIHHNDLSISGRMIASNISIKGLSGDIAMSCHENVAEACAVGGLNILVLEEDSVHLRMHIRVVSVILVIVVVKHV